MWPLRPDQTSSPGLLMVTVTSKIGVARLELGEFVPKNEIAPASGSRGSGALARPAGLGEITRHAHHGRDTDAAADQDDASASLPVKMKVPLGASISTSSPEPQARRAANAKPGRGLRV